MLMNCKTDFTLSKYSGDQNTNYSGLLEGHYESNSPTKGWAMEWK